MLNKPSTCQICPLYSKGAGYVKHTGSGKNGVLIVLGPPTKDEAFTVVPAAGKTGFALTQLLQRGGMNRKEFAFANIISCMPPFGKLHGQPYERMALDSCNQYLIGS